MKDKACDVSITRGGGKVLPLWHVCLIQKLAVLSGRGVPPLRVNEKLKIVPTGTIRFSEGVPYIKKGNFGFRAARHCFLGAKLKNCI